jgi:hypothetical protein
MGLDDYFMLAALVVAVGLAIMNGFHVSWGTGYVLLLWRRLYAKLKKRSRHGKDLDYSIILIPTFKHW